MEVREKHSEKGGGEFAPTKEYSASPNYIVQPMTLSPNNIKRVFVGKKILPTDEDRTLSESFVFNPFMTSSDIPSLHLTHNSEPP